MTDQELLTLVQGKSVRQLSSDELRALQSGLEKSDALRDLFSSRLRWQQYYAELQVRFSSELATDQPPRDRVTWRWSRFVVVTGGILAICIVIGIGVHRFLAKVPSNDSSLPDVGGDTRGPQLRSDSSPNDAAALAFAPPSNATSETPEVAGRIDERDVDGLESVSQDRQAALPTFAQTCFAISGVNQAPLSLDDLKHWLRPASADSKWISERTPRGPGAGMLGLHKLKVDWPQQSFLRLSLATRNPFRMHFFVGIQGATMEYYPEGHGQWVAYVTERDPESVAPRRWSLASGGSPSTAGTFELHYHDGAVTLARGDHPVLQVPLPGHPTSLFFDGRAAFQDIDLIPYQGDLPSQFLRPQATKGGLPMSWSPDDSLTPSETTDAIVIPGGTAHSTSLQAQTPGEYVLRIDHAEPGDSLQLTDRHGEFIARWEYVAQAEVQGICLLSGFRAGDAVPSMRDGPLPCLHDGHWFRIVIGAGVIRWWIGVDGAAWGLGSQPLVVPTADLGRLTVTAKREERPANLAIVESQFRAFRSFLNTGGKPLPKAALTGVQHVGYDEWLARVLAACPASASAERWVEACAAAQLAQGGIGRESLDLADEIVRRAILSNRSVAECIVLLNQLSLLFPPTEASQARIDKWFVRLGLSTLERPDARPLSQVRRGLIGAGWPLNPNGWKRLVTAELLLMLEAREWTQVIQFCEMLRYFGVDQQIEPFDWSVSYALRMAQRSSSLPSSSFSIKQHRSWRDLLVEEANSNLYRAEAELRSAIENGQWREACNVIARYSSAEPIPGYAAVSDDDRLLMSWPAIVEDVLSRHRSLRDSMQETFSDLAKMRVEQAFRTGDEQLAKSVATHFAGTKGAGRANRWLAERALSVGWLETSKHRFRLAFDDESGSSETALRPAESVLDRFLGQGREDSDIKRRMRSAMAERRMSSGLPIGDGTGADSSSDQQANWQTKVRFEIEDPVGQYPSKATLRSIQDFSVDWVGRQLGMTTRNGTLYVSNRFQVLAFDTATGRRLWQSEEITGRPAKAQDWPLIGMPPTVFTDRVVARLLYGTTPVLACFDQLSGDLRWSVSAESGSEFISDSWWVHDQLFCLAAAKTDLNQLDLNLVKLDPETGSVWQTDRILTIRDHWKLRRVCQVRVLDETVAVTLGGVIVCFDHVGQVRWLRRRLSVPPEAEPLWVKHEYQPPLPVADQILVSEPGGWSLSCLDSQTGRRRWHRTLPEMTALIAADEEVVVVREEEGVRGVALKSGATRWMHRRTRFDTVALDDRGRSLFLIALTRNSSRGPSATFVRIDVRSGSKEGSGQITGFVPPPAQIGPALVMGKNLWVAGGATGDAFRTIGMFAP